ncbi:hypothetical protein PR002_g29961 [Phytophthora rubi]|uniref:Uncharacterized protein n=1 Tax=Phytophthora rubi TaxID=129364 RepID=A0A6A3GVY1_9STRA|nr:hypothetical protein PR002_g29961 [Phytophthora rubi]
MPSASHRLNCSACRLLMRFLLGPELFSAAENILASSKFPKRFCSSMMTANSSGFSSSLFNFVT